VDYIKDIIYKRQLHTDDVLKTMNLEREGSNIDLFQLRASLKLLDPTLNNYTALKAAEAILMERKEISMKELSEFLGCIEEEGKSFNLSWFKDILFKIKVTLS